MVEAHEARSGNRTRRPRTSTIGYFYRPSRNVHRHPRHSGTSRNASTGTPNTGEAYIRQSDGTPELKKPLNFTASIESDAGRESITMVRSTNPEYVTDQVWEKLHVWVHNWILQRIPEVRKNINTWWKTLKREQTPRICFSIRYSDSQHAIPNSVLQGCESEDEDPTIGDGSVRFDGAPMDTGSIYQYEMFDTIQDADRHQIESPKRSTKNSTQGRLPHSNNGSTIEFLRSQSLPHMVTPGAAHRPSALWRQTAALEKGSSGHDECAAEEGAKERRGLRSLYLR
jgi:hypothetical protein